MRAKAKLAKMGPDAVEPLIAVLDRVPAPPSNHDERSEEDDINSGIAADAGEILAEIGDPRAVPAMLNRIDDFFGLHYALAKMPEGFDALLGTLADPSADRGARYQAAAGLSAAASRQEDAIEVLLDLVGSRTQDVLNPAIISLGILGEHDQRAIEALQAVANDRDIDEGDRLTAEKRLGNMDRTT